MCRRGCGKGCRYVGGWGVLVHIDRRGIKESSLEQLNKFLPFRPQFPHLSEQSSVEESESRIN